MIIDGKIEAAILREEIKKEIVLIKEKTNKAPKLVVILIGEFTPSQIYVRNKQKNSQEVGIESEVIRYPKNVTEEEILKKIKVLNANKETSGILVQLPLPAQISKKKIINAIPESEDLTWTPIGIMLMSNGSILFQYDPQSSNGWISLLDFKKFRLKNISRIAMSPQGDMVALVAEN